MSYPDKLELGNEYPAPGESALIDEIVKLFHNFIKRKYHAGNARRDAHAKMHGCVRAEFAVDSRLPPALEHGVFKKGAKYPALIRFSNCSPEPDFDDTKADVRGMAIKLLDVEGPKLLENERSERTQDFLLINPRIFFSPNLENYRDFSRDFVTVDDWRKAWGIVKYLFRHPHSFLLFLKSQQKIENPLTITYSSTVPYKLGPNSAVKYAARSSNLSPKVSNSSPDFLRQAMAAHLKTSDAFFDFMVQVQTDAYKMPVEDSSVEWDESEAPFVKVATIRIPKQSFDAPEQLAFGENLSYTPWHSLPEHQPLGGINRCRKAVYESSSQLRHRMNDVPRREPNSLSDFPDGK